MQHPPRDRWATRTAFILAAIGSAVGLGNIWRFPHVAFGAGGGAFLIPYFIALLTAGIPLLMLEYGLGHRMQAASPAAMARVSRKFEFSGWWAAAGGLLITFYYTIIMAWVCFYIVELLGSLGGDSLPWQKGQAESYLFSSVITGDENIRHEAGLFSPINWKAIIFNGLVWGFIYFAIRKGVHSVGKVVWVTVLLPYVLLFVLFFTSINLDGASAGMSYYLSPDWSKMDSPGEILKVASAAYGQIFFSLSIGFGIMMAYASFLPKKSDIANNAIITAFANSGTEFFAGFITFSVLGFLALNKGLFVGDVVGESSFALALISYPTAIENIQIGTDGQILFGLAFFGSLLLLGVDSAFSLTEAMVAGIHDKFSVSRKTVTVSLCVLGWLVGIIFCTPTGLVLLDSVDHYLSNYGLLLIGLIPCLAIGWIYGTKRLRTHINRVSEKRITPFWDFCIRYFTPIVLIFLLGYQAFTDLSFLWDEQAKPYSGYSLWVQLVGIGVLVAAFTLALFLTKKKPEKEGYQTIPEFEYEP